jgi:hypothetical protein
MRSDRKKPDVAFWVTVVVVVVLALPISFGPACWITSRMNFGAPAVHRRIEFRAWCAYFLTVVALSSGGSCNSMFGPPPELPPMK